MKGSLSKKFLAKIFDNLLLKNGNGIIYKIL